MDSVKRLLCRIPYFGPWLFVVEEVEDESDDEFEEVRKDYMRDFQEFVSKTGYTILRPDDDVR